MQKKALHQSEMLLHTYIVSKCLFPQIPVNAYIFSSLQTKPNQNGSQNTNIKSQISNSRDNFRSSVFVQNKKKVLIKRQVQLVQTHKDDSQRTKNTNNSYHKKSAFIRQTSFINSSELKKNLVPCHIVSKRTVQMNRIQDRHELGTLIDYQMSAVHPVFY